MSMPAVHTAYVHADQIGTLEICDLRPQAGEQHANARLIAAAPAMYEALTELVGVGYHHEDCDHWQTNLGCNCWIKRARAALAKAEGR